MRATDLGRLNFGGKGLVSGACGSFQQFGELTERHPVGAQHLTDHGVPQDLGHRHFIGLQEIILLGIQGGS